MHSAVGAPDRLPRYFRSMLKYLVLPACLLLLACGDGKSEAARELAAQQEPANTIDLRAYDLPLVVTLPDNVAQEGDSLFGKPLWVEAFGHLRIRAGEHFDLVITEDIGDIARLKADLERDMLRSHEVLEETVDKLVYHLEYPDEDLVFIHVYQVIHVGDRTFVVESAKDGRFNESDVARMAAAVHPAASL